MKNLPNADSQNILLLIVKGESIQERSQKVVLSPRIDPVGLLSSLLSPQFGWVMLEKTYYLSARIPNIQL